jgi:hypothetical protein
VEQYYDGFDIEHPELGYFWITKQPIKVKGDSLFVPPDVVVFRADPDMRLEYFDPKKHMKIWGPRSSIDFIILEPDTLSFSLELDKTNLGGSIFVGWVARGTYSMRFILNERYPSGRYVFQLSVGEEIKRIKKKYLK